MGQINDYISPFKRLANLYIESGKLSLTEALTMILAGALITFVCLLFVIISLAFISFGVIDALAAGLGLIWAYLIVGGFYLLLIIMMIVFRRTLVINPIARFLSKIILDTPGGKKLNDNEED
ncbi:MAG: phage holin family protein [Barnesiella sp.]|nr:phage holin family protein [Barnesiella sp.]